MGDRIGGREWWWKVGKRGLISVHKVQRLFPMSNPNPILLFGKQRNFLKVLTHNLIQHFAHTFTCSHSSLDQRF